MEKYDYIIGPDSLALIKPKYVNTSGIYIFGETPKKTNECKNTCKFLRCVVITTFLEKLFKFVNENNIKTAFILEGGNHLKGESELFMDTKYIYNKFLDEFNGKSKYKNITFEAIDIKKVGDYSLFLPNESFAKIKNLVQLYEKNKNAGNTKQILSFLEELKETNLFENLINTFLFSNNFIKDIKKIKTDNIYLNFYMVEVTKHMKDYEVVYNKNVYNRVSKILVELKAANPKIYDNLEKYLKDYISQNNAILDNYLTKLINHLNNENFADFYETINYAASLLTKMIDIISDAYFIAYYFLKLANENYEYVIFYLKTDSVRKISEFFKFIDFKILYHAYNKHSNCVPVVDITFFNKRH